MALTSAQFEDVIASSLYNEIVDLINGATGGGEPVLLTDYSHATTPNLTVQSGHATGTPLRVKQTISAVEYDLIKVTNGATLAASTTYVRNLIQYGVKVFEIGTISGEATSAIQTVISEAKNAISSGQYWGATIRFKGFVYDVSALDCTETHNLNFEGAAGMAGTMFRPIYQTSGTHSATGKAVFDCAGSATLTFSGILVDASGGAPAGVRPMAGWLLAGTGVAGVNCTAFRFFNCATQGEFQSAGLITTFSSDHHFVGCSFAQYALDRPAVLTGSAVPSGVGTITTLSPNGLASAYGGGGGDITFTHCEAHCQPRSGGYLAPAYPSEIYNGGGGDAIRVHGSRSIKWDRGPISGHGSSHIRISGTNGSLVFDTLQHYTDFSAYRPDYIYRIEGAAVINSLSIREPSFSNVPVAGGAFWFLGADAQLDRVEFMRPDNVSAPATTFMTSGLYTSATAIEILKWGSMDCMGFPINLTASGGNSPSIGPVELLNPGTITKSATSTNKSRVIGDGFLTINGGGTKAAATAGLIRIQQNTGIFAANNANSANVRLVSTDTGDNVLIGDSTVTATYFINAVTTGTLAIAGTAKIAVNTTGIGFNNAPPIAPTNFTITNATADRLTLDQTSGTATEVREVLGTVIKYLISYGLFS